MVEVFLERLDLVRGGEAELGHVYSGKVELDHIRSVEPQLSFEDVRGDCP